MRIGWLLLATSALAQIPTPVRTVTSLPGTCNGGTGGVSTDTVMLLTSSVTVPKECAQTNIWTNYLVGGVNAQTVNYAPVLTDAGQLISMNGANLTLTLPNPVINPSWAISVENLNATNLTIARNGLLIDGAAANLSVTTNGGAVIYTDGTNYFTFRGGGGGGGTPGSPTGTLQGNNGGAFAGIPGTTFSTTAGGPMSAMNFANNLNVDRFNWTESPAGTLSAGANTVTLGTITSTGLTPLGVDGTNILSAKRPHVLYIAGTGTPEWVLITGGSCAAQGTAGTCTVTFNAAFSHGAGFTIASGTAGYQEAVYYAFYLKSLFPASQPIYDSININGNSGAIVHFRGPLFINANSLSFLNFEAGSIECDFFANCVQIGDTWWMELMNGSTANPLGSYSNIFRDVTIAPGLASWIVTPSAAGTTCNLGGAGVSVITVGSSTCTVTIPTGPSGFYAAQPGQVIWLNGTNSGLESTYRGTGEEAMVTGGTCANGGASCTITIVPAEPWVTTFSAHDAGFSLSSGINAMFEDNGQGTTWYTPKTSFPTGGVVNSGYGHMFQIDNDQAAVIHGFNVVVAYRLTDNAEFSGSYLFGPGDFGHYPGIVTLTDSALSLQCTGAGVEWYSGNGISLKDVIIQGWTRFASKLAQNRGGFGVATYYDVYSENGNCTDQVTGGNGPDMIINGYNVTRFGGNQPANVNTTYLNIGGQTQQTYYIVHTDGGTNKSRPTPIGQAIVNDPSANNVTVKWATGVGGSPAVGTYDLLRVTGTTSSTAASAPIGTGNWAVTTGLVPSSVCTVKGVCSFTDNLANASLGSYTVPTTGGAGGGNPNFFPVLPHWSTGGIVLTGSGNATFNSDPGGGYGSYFGVATCPITPVLAAEPVIKFNDYARYGIGSGISPCLSSPRGTFTLNTNLLPVGTVNPAAMLYDIPGYGGSFSAASTLTGRLNFGINRNNIPHDLVTIADYAIDTTEATNFGASSSTVPNRRAIIANDSGIGVDGTNSSVSSLMVHAGTAIDQYIGAPTSTPDCGAATCFERLTSSLKTFKVTIQAASGTNTTPTLAGSLSSNTGLNIGSSILEFTLGGNYAMALGTTANQMDMGSAWSYGVSSNANPAAAGQDIGWSRLAAGVASWDGTVIGDGKGKQKAAGYMSVGTTFTSNAGCTESALTGGATAGKFTVGTSSTCSMIVTMGNSATAPNGWACSVWDITTPATVVKQTNFAATTATFTFTTPTTSDVAIFSCVGF